jgi:hypothetical protein
LADEFEIAEADFGFSKGVEDQVVIGIKGDEEMVGL